MNRTVATVAVLLAACAITVGYTRSRLFHDAARIKSKSDVYALPPPPVLRVMSMGYQAALADYLWAHVLVTQGLRAGERRPFGQVDRYLNAINFLAPKFREPYRLTDSLFMMQIADPNREESCRKARTIMERGVRERPHDAELWLNYGQFMAYIAPGTLSDPEERDEWRKEGARALAKVAELAGRDENMLERSMSAAALLTRQGERDAAIRFLERAYALTENEETRADIQRRLSALLQGQQASRDVVFVRAFDSLWRSELPFVSRSMMSVLGPPVPVWSCAGPPRRPDDASCQRDWRAWSSELDTSSEP